MKKIILILSLVFLFAGCDDNKESLPDVIDAPYLPVSTLYWGMDVSKCVDAFRESGYVKVGTNANMNYYQKFGETDIWRIEATGKLHELRCYITESNANYPKKKEYFATLFEVDATSSNWNKKYTTTSNTKISFWEDSSILSYIYLYDDVTSKFCVIFEKKPEQTPRQRPSLTL